MSSCRILPAVVLLCLWSFAGPLQATPTAEQLAGASAAFLEEWRSEQPPFGFRYGGKDSRTFLASWEKTELPAPAKDGARWFRFRDPATKLQVLAEVRALPEFGAVEWVLEFANEGTADSPILEKVQALRRTVPVRGTGDPLLHYALGSDAVVSDFAPQVVPVWPRKAVDLASSGGRSSEGVLPFFNYQDGESGVIGAIGWTGNWTAHFQRKKGEPVEMSAGMAHLHLVLHPGEKIRSPRMMLMAYEGGTVAAHNRWRQLMLAHNSPKDQRGQTITLPACLATWGNEPVERKLATARELREQGIGFDTFWVDAGWYGDIPFVEGANVFTTPWNKVRGNWWPNKSTFPKGLRELGEGLKALDLGLLVWFEPEQADVGSKILQEHPDWFFPGSPTRARLLNLGNPEARAGITKFISQQVADAGLTWFRQDFNVSPEATWAAADAPDRVGMTEIRYIEGLYAMWDELRAAHPGLQIDNCASGGRRIDIETMRRAVPLWRTDHSCFSADPMGIALQTQALAPWVPLSAGSCEGNDTYAIRSAYGPGLVVDTSMNFAIAKDPAWLKASLKEFREVQQYFTGDFYPLLDYGLGRDAWTAWQFHRPDKNAGIAMFLRRAGSPLWSIELHLQALEAEAKYEVEIRHNLGAGEKKTMAGKELGGTVLAIPEAPGATLLMYRRR